MSDPVKQSTRLSTKILLAGAVGLGSYAIGATWMRASSTKPGVEPIVKSDKPLPAWKPRPGWVAPRAGGLGSDGRLELPFYPPFTDEQAATLFLRTRGEVFDELCGDLWQPNLDERIPFAEYPGGSFRLRTNSLGFREDSDPAAERPALRILVTGDSHTDGVCANEESFPNLLEAALAENAAAQAAGRGEKFERSSIEVLNAGKGSYSFYNYLGVLERFLSLEPHVFVVAVFGGNDFEEALSVWHFYFNEGKRPRGLAADSVEMAATLEINKGAAVQGVGSAMFFAQHPEQEEIAKRAAFQVLDDIHALCTERGIRLIVVYVPSWMEVSPDDAELRLDELLNAVGIARADLSSATRMADAMIEHLAAREVEVVDLRAPFAAASERLYWKLDCHLGLAGHALAARELARRFSRQ